MSFFRCSLCLAPFVALLALAREAEFMGKPVKVHLLGQASFPCVDLRQLLQPGQDATVRAGQKVAAYLGQVNGVTGNRLLGKLDRPEHPYVDPVMHQTINGGQIRLEPITESIMQLLDRQRRFHSA